MGLLRQRYPRTGADFAGVVESLGPGVTEFSVADRVFGTLSPLHDGAFEEYAVASTRHLAKMPGNASFEQAAGNLQQRRGGPCEVPWHLPCH
jgi:NADPH:quinone reductase-like Zn-dependent oxidoreductase